MTTALAPREATVVTVALALPGDRLTDLRVDQAKVHLGLSHDDSVRHRARESWAGPGSRLHGHHTSAGTPGGHWLFKAAVLDAFLAGATYLEQITACGPSCPEATSNVSALRPPTGPPARAAHRSPGRRR